MDKNKDKKKIKLKVEIDPNKVSLQHPVGIIPSAYFPYPPYPQQISIIETIHKAIRNSENALIESPTGTGKTLCLLVGALSYFSKTEERSKIVYLSRTHSQISQTIKELKKTPYKYRLTVIGSRESMCVNPRLKMFKGRILDKKCEDLCAMGSCGFRNIPKDAPIIEACDIGELKEKALKAGLCPYYYSKQSEERSQIVILPYNYVLDTALLENRSVSLTGSVMIFDEAHNVDNIAQEGSSFTLSWQSINSALILLKEYLDRCFKHREAGVNPRFQPIQTGLEVVFDFKKILECLGSAIDKLDHGYQFEDYTQLIIFIRNSTKSSSHRTLFQQGLTSNNLQEFISCGKETCSLVKKKGFPTFLLEQLIKSIHNLFQIGKFIGKGECSIYVKQDQPKKVIAVSCLTSAVTFRQIKSFKPRSIILASGTLSSFKYWQQDTDLSFPQQLNSPSFITPQHMYASAVKAYAGQEFEFVYSKRTNTQQIKALISFLKDLGGWICEQQVIKKIGKGGGIVVAFSSYDLMDSVTKELNSEGLAKPIFKETKQTQPEVLLRQYAVAISTQGGAYLFTIMRGKFSQGIDFTDQLCRAMVIVGIPFPPPTDKKVLDKKSYLSTLQNCMIGAQEWYLMHTMRVVNQAIGRAVRHANDYGAVFLLDKRFSRPEIMARFSDWFKRCLRPTLNSQQFISFCKREDLENIFEKKLQKQSCKEEKPVSVGFKTAKRLLIADCRLKENDDTPIIKKSLSSHTVFEPPVIEQPINKKTTEILPAETLAKTPAKRQNPIAKFHSTFSGMGMRYEEIFPDNNINIMKKKKKPLSQLVQFLQKPQHKINNN